MQLSRFDSDTAIIQISSRNYISQLPQLRSLTAATIWSSPKSCIQSAPNCRTHYRILSRLFCHQESIRARLVQHSEACSSRCFFCFRCATSIGTHMESNLQVLVEQRISASRNTQGDSIDNYWYYPRSLGRTVRLFLCCGSQDEGAVDMQAWCFTRFY